jgi:hypothetical protein
LARPFVVAAAASLLSAGLSLADGPQAQDTEQRLKSLEAKMDRVLSLLGNRPDAQPPASPDAANSAVEEARTKVRAALAARLREFETLQRNFSDSKMLAERIGKLETLRQDVKIKLQEMADQLVRIQTAFKAGGPEKAMRIINALRPITDQGDPLIQLNKMLFTLELRGKEISATFGPDHPRVKEIESRIAEIRRITGRQAAEETKALGDDVTSYMDDIKQQIDSATTKIETLTNMIEQDKAKAREAHAIEVKRDRLQAEIDRLRHMLAGLDAVLQSDPGARPR